MDGEALADGERQHGVGVGHSIRISGRRSSLSACKTSRPEAAPGASDTGYQLGNARALGLGGGVGVGGVIRGDDLIAWV